MNKREFFIRYNKSEHAVEKRIACQSRKEFIVSNFIERVGALPSQEEQRFFAWLCAVRSLPFLSLVRKFSYWGRDIKIQKNLQSVFFAVDIASGVAKSASYAAQAAYDASYIANANTVAIANANAVVFAAAHAARAYAYTDNTYDVADAARNAVRAANFMPGDQMKNLSQKFQEILSNDFEAILAGKYDELNNDTSIYGALWENFQNDLSDIGCKYWATLYANIFASRFHINDEALRAAEQRISVPAEIRQRGAETVADYLESAQEQGLVYVQRETRLIILGSAGAGKTTLAKRLNGEIDYPAVEDSTHGVDTRIKLDFNGIKTHVWDFGGQVIYHASHRCFLSENCVYILVVNARTEDNRDANRIKYWLDTMRVYSENNAKVFIIINESDNREQNVDDYNSFKDGEYGQLIQDIFSFNVGKDIASVCEFKKILADYIETFGHQVFGKNDSNVIAQIETLFEQNTQIIKSNKLEGILKKHNIHTKKDQSRAKELFNTLGVALSYDFMDNHVLDPYWISHGVYLVIDYLQKSKSTFINYNNLNAVFADERSAYPEDKYEYIFKLMEYYKIGFRNKDGIHGLIIPCAASQFKPKDIIVETDPDNIVTQVERDDLQEFPADFFYKFICANEVAIKKNGEKWAMWQEGMVLSEGDTSALVELKENRRIEITVWGAGKDEYREKLESLIDHQLKEYHFDSYREERKRGNKLVNMITLVLESVTKGITKAFIESSSR